VSIGPKKPGFAAYYRAQIQAVDGSFVLEVGDPQDVAAALVEKFRRDLKVAHAPRDLIPPKT
jgi:hypothetical protein